MKKHDLKNGAGYHRLLIVFILLLAVVSCKQEPQAGSKNRLTPDPGNGGIQLPEGFHAVVVADSLGWGRHLVVRNNGDVYIRLRTLKDGFGTVALRDTSGDGKADIIRYFGHTAGTGIALHKGYLYVSDFNTILRYRMHGDSLLPDPAPEIVVSGFEPQNQHQDKPFAFDNQGHLYVNIGAPSNACMVRTRTPGSPGMDPCPQLEKHAGIFRFSDDTPGQTLDKDGYRYATGIRNSIAIRWNKYANHLYVVQHGRDQLHQFFPELYSEDQGVNLPAEEFLLVEEGSDFGWPYCYYDLYQNKKVLAPEYGGNGTETGRCETKDDPIMAFPAHMAPNDVLFYEGSMFPERYRHGAFIAFHGSWNRAPQEQKGYFVAFVPFEHDLPAGDWEDFATGFPQVDYVASPGNAVYRPTGLAVGPDGSLYISDSRRGRIWRVFYRP